jgi:hypothetical protein
MHNVLLILLHRPFVSDGHLHYNPSNTVSSFMVCATAATVIVHILRAYDRAFSTKRAPYLISYATYVSATIHVRIAAQRESGSEAHACLTTCLNVFKKNQETNWAVRRANLIIRNLMKRMNVIIKDGDLLETGQIVNLQPVIDDTTTHNHRNVAGEVVADDPDISLMNLESRANTVDNEPPNLDIDAIIQSFIRNQQTGQQRPQILRTETMAYPTSMSTEQWFPSTTFGVPAGEDMNTMGSAQGRTPNINQNIGYDTNFEQVQSLTGGLSVDDMLFGFNSSAVEGIGWEFENGSQ